MADPSMKPDSVVEADSTCGDGEKPAAQAPLVRFRLMHLFVFTAAVGLYLQLCTLIPWVVPWLVPIAVFVVALQPYLGRLDIPISNACFTASIWAAGVNTVATPVAIMIGEATIVEGESPYHGQDLKIPIVFAIFGILALGFFGAMIGVICSLMMSSIALAVRGIALRGS